MTGWPAAGTLAGESTRAALLAAGFVALLAGSEAWHRRAGPPVEWTRKALHLAFGVAAGALPWIVRSSWTVLALTVMVVLPLTWARRRGLLPSLFDVERRTYGEVYFPAGVYLLFLVGSSQRVFYGISIFMLVICDALAALLGRSYGRHPYRVQDDQRSLEGSAAFLLTAFLGTHLPLLLFTGLDRGASVMIAAQLALLVTAFEAISLGGVDNLVLPLATYYLLAKLTPATSAAIGWQLAAQLGLLGAMLVLAWRTRYLTFGGAVAAHLVLYGAFSLGGPAWAVAPALALAVLVGLDRAHRRRLGTPGGRHDVRAIFYVAIVPTLWLFADNSFATLLWRPGALGSGHPFHVLFAGTLAGALATIAHWTMESMPRLRRRSPTTRALASGALGCVAVALPGVWVMSSERAAAGIVLAMLVCALGLATHLALRRLARPQPWSLWDLRLLALGVLVGSLAVLPLRLWSLGMLAPGRP